MTDERIDTLWSTVVKYSAILPHIRKFSLQTIWETRDEFHFRGDVFEFGMQLAADVLEDQSAPTASVMQDTLARHIAAEVDRMFIRGIDGGVWVGAWREYQRDDWETLYHYTPRNGTIIEVAHHMYLDIRSHLGDQDATTFVALCGDAAWRQMNEGRYSFRALPYTAVYCPHVTGLLMLATLFYALGFCDSRASLNYDTVEDKYQLCVKLPISFARSEWLNANTHHPDYAARTLSVDGDA